MLTALSIRDVVLIQRLDLSFGAGLTVLTLHRTRFGSLELGDLPPGQWRELPLDAFEQVGSGP